MFIFENVIPGYLLKKGNIVRTVLFTAIFALAFINFYSPFGINKWYHLDKIQLLFYSSLVILTGVLVVAISRIIMYHYGKKYEINYFKYFVWVIIEILSMASFYTFFVIFFLNDERQITDIFRVTIKNTSLVLLPAYSILWLFFSFREKSQQLEELSDNEEDKKVSNKMIPFYDEKGTLRFSVLLSDLLHLEACENYVKIVYVDKNKVSKFMIRNTLKTIEQSLSGTNIIRCHRSYLVNFEKVKILRKEKDGLRLELNTDQELWLPVSKTYLTAVIEAFSKFTA